MKEEINDLPRNISQSQAAETNTHNNTKIIRTSTYVETIQNTGVR